MKRIVRICVILMIITLLGACSNAEKPSAGTTKPASTPTTAATAPATSPSTEPVQLTEEEKFKNLLMEYQYWRAFSCTFERPEEISLEYYFFSGINPNDRQNGRTFTEEEKAYLVSEWGNTYGEDPWNFASKMPVAKINEELSALGLALDALKIPERWLYYDKTDSYYIAPRGVFGVGGVTVTKVEKSDNGQVSVYWQTDLPHTNTATGEFWENGVKMVITLQEKPDGSYLVLSNVPQK